ncbi:MAG TPA: type II secretion system protein [Longimicrobiales bacterium]|nr:type II secretion system protein [Longimicrobiales bacterium]
MRYRAGYSIVELVLALLILGIIAGIAVPATAGARDRIAVGSARAELAAAVATARSTAIVAGGATLVIDGPRAVAWIETPAQSSTVRHDVGARYGVTLRTARDQPVSLRFDALGIGRMTATTVRVRRGTREAALVVSAYGRVRQ